MDLAPVIDLRPWFDGDDGDGTGRAGVAAAVDAACRTSGFLQVTGHGIDDALITGMLDAADRFFALPMDDKLTCVPADPAHDRGYAARGSESLTYSLGVVRPPDLFEAFNVGDPAVPVEYRDDPALAAFFGPNIWPTALDIAAPVLAYYTAAKQLGVELTRVFAAALRMPADHVVPLVVRSICTMRLIHYERHAGDPAPLQDQQRMGAHTDYGLLTVLYADRVPGLEVLGDDAEWHGVVPEPGALIINVGDLLARWSNDRWRSTLHRVVPPPSGADGAALRRSTALFIEGNPDAVIECLPTCVDDEHPARHGPVTAGDHLLAKLLGPRTLRLNDDLTSDDERVALID